MKTELTLEESTKLIELGIDKKLASKYRAQFFPIFTLTDILKLIPKEINEHPIDILWDSYCNEWQAEHLGLENCCGGLELIDALYQLLIWTIENKYGRR